MRIPFLDLQAMTREIRADFDARAEKILEQSSFILGEEVDRFERDFAAFCGVEHAVGVASGLDAIKLALRAVGIGPGDEVITAANSFIATALAVSAVGATPVLVDCDPVYYTLDIGRLEAAVTPRTRAVLPVHLYGQPADMDGVRRIAQRHGLLVVEDAAQAHGARFHGVRAGALGDLAAFSFYPGKNLGAFGDGGAVTTDRADWAEKVRLLRNYGSVRKYHHEIAGENSRLDSLQAAVLDVKLQHLDAWNAARRRVAAWYAEELTDVADLVLPAVMPGAEPVFHLYVVRAPRRDALLDHLASRGVQALIHYPIPIHLQQAYADAGWRKGAFPVAETCAGEFLSLPLFPTMTRDQVAYVADQVRGFFQP